MVLREGAKWCHFHARCTTKTRWSENHLTRPQVGPPFAHSFPRPASSMCRVCTRPGEFSSLGPGAPGVAVLLIFVAVLLAGHGQPSLEFEDLGLCSYVTSSAGRRMPGADTAHANEMRHSPRRGLAAVAPKSLHSAAR